MTLDSALYRGQVSHTRRGSPSHAFSYPVYLHLVDLSELGTLDRTLRLFAWNHSGLVSFHDADYLVSRHGTPAGGAGDLLARLRAVIADRGATWPGGAVRLLTSCRVAGYVFNPISVFFCYDADEHLALVVAEVSNTFSDRHAYVLPVTAGTRTGRIYAWDEKKVLHVSPFYPLDGTYHFEIEPPAGRTRIRIDYTCGAERWFTATLSLGREPLTDRTLARMLLRYPLMPARVVTAIHWEAIRLWWKRAPFRTRPPYDPEAARRGAS